MQVNGSRGSQHGFRKLHGAAYQPWSTQEQLFILSGECIALSECSVQFFPYKLLTTAYKALDSVSISCS